MKIELSRPFALNGEVDEFDVRQMKKALNRLGYYQPYDKVGITGIADEAVFTALKTFQADYNLAQTGAAKPDDETIAALNREIARVPDGQYIWRTVGDDKVRGAHAAYNYMVRDWSDSPDPGEDYNCRCWAEPIEPGLNPVYPELLLMPALKARSVWNLLRLTGSQLNRIPDSSKVKLDDTRTWPKPPTSSNLKEGLPSRQKPRLRGEKSLYDENGGEWRYAIESKHHNPHWDYKASPKSEWENISINGKPTHKGGY